LCRRSRPVATITFVCESQQPIGGRLEIVDDAIEGGEEDFPAQLSTVVVLSAVSPPSLIISLCDRQ
jgi:hypothetical protein